MVDNKYGAFQAWFNRKWAEWDAYNERRSTQYELAEHLGITRSAVAQYTSGRQIPDIGNIVSIASKFGDEIYEILGVDKPVPELTPSAASLVQDIKSAIKKSGLDTSKDTEEGNQMLAEILREFLSSRTEKR